MLTILDAEPLVLCADEQGRDDVADDEQNEEVVVESWVAVCVEYGQQN